VFRSDRWTIIADDLDRLAAGLWERVIPIKITNSKFCTFNKRWKGNLLQGRKVLMIRGHICGVAGVREGLSVRLALDPNDRTQVSFTQ
jgi:hypothetical protein